MRNGTRGGGGLRGVVLRWEMAMIVALALMPMLSARASQPEGGVEAAARAFLAAFDDLDMRRFLDAFADDATVVHPPSAPPRTFPTRIQGKAEIARTFGVVFDEVRRASGRTAPPYQHIDPQDLLVQQYGDVAVVTFHLGTATRRGRRTVVFRQTPSGWRIVHLHASMFEAPAK